MTRRSLGLTYRDEHNTATCYRVWTLWGFELFRRVFFHNHKLSYSTSAPHYRVML